MGRAGLQLWVNSWAPRHNVTFWTSNQKVQATVGDHVMFPVYFWHEAYPLELNYVETSCCKLRAAATMQKRNIFQHNKGVRTKSPRDKVPQKDNICSPSRQAVPAWLLWLALSVVELAEDSVWVALEQLQEQVARFQPLHFTTQRLLRHVFVHQNPQTSHPIDPNRQDY